jgi:hypothetical protein
MDIHYGVRIAFFLFIGREIDFNRQIAVQLDVISAAGNFDDWNIGESQFADSERFGAKQLGIGLDIRYECPLFFVLVFYCLYYCIFDNRSCADVCMGQKKR